MKAVEPSYEIWQIPDGEQALALIERVGRIAYKSEDKIVKGEMCGSCGGTGYGVIQCNEPCDICDGTGWTTEPSSHAFVRMIMKAERKAKMIVVARETLHEYVNQPFEAMDAEELSRDLVNNIVEYMEDNPAHESVIEHSSITVWFRSNRGFTHELVRHRLAAFTQESTRYCNYSKGKFGGEITVCPDRRPYLENAEKNTVFTSATDGWEAAVEYSGERYNGLIKAGIKPQIARDVLPQVTKAEIACTANFREWKHVLRMRDSKNAHPDMQYLMGPLHDEFRSCIPIIFD